MGSISRRGFLQQTALGAAAGYAAAALGEAPTRPNVLLIVTDDQGYGDLGCHGNSQIRTPKLDRLHAESVRLTQFHAGPVCSPTRAGLMTGRYHYRTGIVDTFQGRSMMRADEVTLAECLAASGYQTGIFGKWHLGDHCPLRAMDQGFQQALVSEGGGIAQPSDPPPGDNHYQDPWLKHNGELKQYPGYCSDIFASAAMEFIEARRAQPFFAYLAFNAPHTPLEVHARYVQPYLDKGLPESTAKVYAMVENVDENIGRLMAKLDALGLRENTLVIFITDNGPYWGEKGPARYNAGMRGQKGTVYEGGLRVPCFVRWPKALPSGLDCVPIAATIDVMPTVLEACGAQPPSDRTIDGLSLLPFLRQPSKPAPGRTLFFQWHRGDAPEAFRSSAVLTDRFKLVDGKELYNRAKDPAEEHDVAAEHPDVVAELRVRYERWFADVSAPHHYAPVRIHLGTPHENPVVLTRQDWRGAPGQKDDSVGHWEVHAETDGPYTIQADFAAMSEPAEIHVRAGESARTASVAAGTNTHSFTDVRLPSGDFRIEAWCECGGTKQGMRYVHVTRL